MTELLRDVFARLNRAQQQTDELLAALEAVDRTHGPLVLVGSKVDQDTKRLVVFITHTADLPMDWGLRLGEVLHNFRSALDHLAYMFAVLEADGAEPINAQGIAFPICDEPTGKHGLDRRTSVRDQVGANGWAVIKGAQPYAGWDGAQYLANLRDLSNLDKHRSLQPALLGAAEWVTSIRIEGHNCRIRDHAQIQAKSITGRPLEEDAEVLTVDVDITGPEPRMEVEVHAAAYIALPNGLAVKDTLSGIRDAVSSVVGGAAPCFLPTVIGGEAEGLPRRIQAAHRRSPRAGVPFTIQRLVRKSDETRWLVVTEGSSAAQPPVEG